MFKHFFDKIALSYLGIILIAFITIMLYASSMTQKNMLEEQVKNLRNQQLFISTEYIEPFEKGNMTRRQLNSRLSQYATTMNLQICCADAKGDIIYTAGTYTYKIHPDSLGDLGIPLNFPEDYHVVNHLNHAYSNSMITLGKHYSASGDQKIAYLLVHSPYSEITNPIRGMMLTFLIPLCLIIIFSMIFLMYLSKRVLNPIDQLNRVSKEYASGNFEMRTGINRDDEIGELALNLEYMASELNKLDEYRSSFIANISHDFRSPLTSIKGYIEAMLDGTIPVENQERYLRIVLSETHRLTKLTSSMLELNKSDSYGLKLKQIDFDIMDIINETADVFEGICSKRYIIIKKLCTARNTIVRADKARIQQVLYNLMDNAVKFCPHGATITLSVYSAKGKVFVSVKDTGQGISREQQNRVWDRFYKGDRSRGKHKQGSGLGLSIIREIIRAHGENITLTSTLGVGSDFTFSLKKGGDSSSPPINSYMTTTNNDAADLQAENEQSPAAEQPHKLRLQQNWPD